MKHINYRAVALAVIATFILSAIWYALFAHQYFSLRGIDPNDSAQTAMSAGQFLVVIVRHILVTLVVAYLLARTNVKTLAAGLLTGFVLWLGFPAVLLIGSVSSDHVPLALAAIHGGDWLIKLLVLGALLGAWQKKTAKQ